MKPPRFTRRLRLWLAPSGSRRDQLFRNSVQFIHRVRSASPEKIVLRLLPPFLARPVRAHLRTRRETRQAPLRARLAAILSAHPGVEPVIVFPPSLDWQVQLFQRPQHLALALARQGALVFYLLRQRPGEADEQEEAFHLLQERLYLCRTPVEVFGKLAQPWVYCLTWNSGYLAGFETPRPIYDYVDEIEAFEGDHKRMRRDHQKLMQVAELVLSTADNLFRETLELRPDALYCPNGANLEHFTRLNTENLPIPEDLAPVIEAGQPVIGYYGALARWFDYDLLHKLALSRTDLSFVLIGPDYDGTLPPALLKCSNVYWLGVKPYAELPGYLRWFDVAMIPFQLNNITHATSPLKLFEYMAGGKPVVITPMHESMRIEGVLAAAGPEAFSQKLDQALALREDPDYLGLLERVARQNTWDARARQILEAISAKKRSPNNGSF